jgi:hypothetical protein
MYLNPHYTSGGCHVLVIRIYGITHTVHHLEIAHGSLNTHP